MQAAISAKPCRKCKRVWCCEPCCYRRCRAGGAFAYVGAMQDSFPHALELSKKGYNAFALIYRPGVQTACEDLARVIRFISTMRTNWKWTPTAAHSGTAPPVREWPHGWEPTVRRRSAAAIFRGPERLPRAGWTMP